METRKRSISDLVQKKGMSVRNKSYSDRGGMIHGFKGQEMIETKPIYNGELYEEQPLDYLSFHMIKTKLQFGYNPRVVNGITYYFDKNNTVVATEEKDMLNLYFDCQNTIGSHHGIAVMGIVKDFKLINYALQKDRKVQLADISVVTGLCGSVKKLMQLNKQVMIESNDLRLEFNPDKNIRNIERNGLSSWLFGHEDRVLTSLRRLKEELMEAKTTFEIGSLSSIGKTIENDCSEVLKFKIDDFIINIDSKMISRSESDIRYNLLKKNVTAKVAQQNNFAYEHYREQLNWYWDAGYNNVSSTETRRKIEALQNKNYHEVENAKVAKLIKK